jgi:hypothetical protein
MTAQAENVMKTLILSVVLLSSARVTAETIAVRAGANLQAALDRAKSGDTIELEAGAMFNGHFTLPVKDGTAVTTLRTAARDVPTTTARVSPADAVKFAKLQTPDQDPALQTAPGAHHWRITLIEVLGAGDGDLVALGDWHQSSPSQVPHDIVVDRVYIHGDPARGRRRGISLNSAATAITNSYISDIKAVGHDTQAIGGSTGPGPFIITNNYLEASTENIMFGGADPAIPNLVPTDITITGNTLTKPESWRKEPWEVKNLFELKNARHVVVRDNTLEYNWLHGQTGFAVLFTVRNQDGACPWCEVSDVVFEHNIVRHSSAGVMILGVDYTHPSKQSHDIVIRNNVFSDIDNQRWGGSGYAFQISGGPRDITIDHNTIIQDHGSGFIQVDGPAIPGFVFTNNVVRHNEYGLAGTNRAPGKDALTFFFPGARFSGNVIADGDASRFPPGNEFPSFQELCKAMASCESHDYKLKPDAKWRGAGAQVPAN